MTPPEPVTAAQCWALLGVHDVGRVAYTENALPTIAPVGYTLVGNRLVLRCLSNRMAAHLDGQVVAFQVDDTGSTRRASCSVVVTATAQRLSAPGTPGPDSHRNAVRLNVGHVRGQRLDIVP